MVTFTSLQDIARSGWCPISSAGPTIASTNFTEPTKSPRSYAFVIASPSRTQPSSSPSFASISSLSSFAMVPPVVGHPLGYRCHIRRVRIASLVPSATEMLYALGLGDQVVGVTHECDFPPEAARETHLTRSIIADGLESGEIDAAVREAVGAGRALYELDEDALAALDVDLIATQAVCEVCAVSYDDVRAVADRLPTKPAVISLDPSRLDEVVADVTRLGEAAGAPEAAAVLRGALQERLAEVRTAVN